jgi:hypothetical protein
VFGSGFTEHLLFEVLKGLLELKKLALGLLFGW